MIRPLAPAVALAALALASPALAAGEVATILPLTRQALPITAQMLPIERAVKPLKAKTDAVARAMQALKAQRTRQGELKLNISADVLFAFDRADIRPQAAHALAQVALLIREKRPRRVRIEGHTDAKGSDAYNMRLSLRRAKAVRTWLAGKEGIPLKLMTVKGFGERKPVAPNTRADGSDDPDGRRLNRRVEIFLR
ncbi:MAG TPA: OmpA family protein [Thermopetrobacter sp.]|nr:OmpA family protein [Thermopetrobacter sp.]